MTLNRSIGQMYPWVDATWNPIQGRCPHFCVYCYMHKAWDFQGSHEQVFKEKYLHGDKGEGKTIFVGSSTDMWAETVPDRWITAIIEHCNLYPKNTYIFQSKNPKRMEMIECLYPQNTILGATIETDDYTQSVTLAPSIVERINAMVILKKIGFKTMISIEPIMKFNLHNMVNNISLIKPEFVSIGADSKKHNLPEPSKNEVELLIKELEKFTEVRLKNNLKRILCQ